MNLSQDEILDDFLGTLNKRWGVPFDDDEVRSAIDALLADRRRMAWASEAAETGVLILAVELEGGVSLTLDRPGVASLVLREQNDARAALDKMISFCPEP